MAHHCKVIPLLLLPPLLLTILYTHSFLVPAWRSIYRSIVVNVRWLSSANASLSSHISTTPSGSLVTSVARASSLSQSRLSFLPHSLISLSRSNTLPRSLLSLFLPPKPRFHPTLSLYGLPVVLSHTALCKINIEKPGSGGRQAGRQGRASTATPMQAPPQHHTIPSLLHFSLPPTYCFYILCVYTNMWVHPFTIGWNFLRVR